MINDQETKADYCVDECISGFAKRKGTKHFYDYTLRSKTMKKRVTQCKKMKDWDRAYNREKEIKQCVVKESHAVVF